MGMMIPTMMLPSQKAMLALFDELRLPGLDGCSPASCIRPEMEKKAHGLSLPLDVACRKQHQAAVLDMQQHKILMFRRLEVWMMITMQQHWRKVQMTLLKAA